MSKKKEAQELAPGIVQPKGLTVPPHIVPLLSPVGQHRRGRKILVTGWPKTGKSFLAASSPHPICAIDCGDENGIQQYLDPEQGDVCLFANDRDSLMSAVGFMLDNEAHFKTGILDPANLAWEGYMDDQAAAWGKHARDCPVADGADTSECNCDPEIAGRWKPVKGPWKSMRRRLRRTPMNIVFTCHIKDIVYEADTTKAPRGESGKTPTKLRSVILPQIEKNIPYDVDFILLTDVERDDRDMPTGWHRVTYLGGRRPRSIPPKELHVGKSWRFDSREYTNPWATIIAPLDAKWAEGAVDHLGLDPQEAARIQQSMELEYQDSELGRLLLLIEKQESLPALKDVWGREVMPLTKMFDTEHMDRLTEAKDQKKAALAA